MIEINQIEILFVEDNHYEAELTIRSLRKNNFVNKLKHIDNGPEALDFIFSRGVYADRKNAQKPKLILLDLNLPKVNGLEILRQIKTDQQTRVIPVVILTSSKEDKDITESYRLGVNSYIVKPLDLDSFNKVVSEIGLYWAVVNLPFEKY